ncbi:MAG TPA: hypothetical protein VN207_09955 [Ktedonobacteraceae bacterium]|nr:hypothetical protein [Ktedonobacteraceae bacterium]
MSNNSYSEDHQFGTEEYQSLIDISFYPSIAKPATFDEKWLRRFDGKNHHDVLRQRKLKMDLEFELLPGVWFDTEEKVVRWPESGRPHTAFYYETESCSLPGLITPGLYEFKSRSLSKLLPTCVILSLSFVMLSYVYSQALS